MKFGKLLEKLEQIKELCNRLGIDFKQLNIEIDSCYTSLYGTEESLELTIYSINTNYEKRRVHLGESKFKYKEIPPTKIFISAYQKEE